MYAQPFSGQVLKEEGSWLTITIYLFTVSPLHMHTYTEIGREWTERVGH